MEYLDYPFRVPTASGRRPTPTAFEHLRKYTDLDLKYSKISNQANLADFQQILNEQSSLYVSTEIRYVIAQLLGLDGLQFETIKSDGSGALHVNIADISATAKQPVSVADGDDVVLGAVADAIVAAGAAGTLSAKLRRLTQGVEDLKTGIEAKIAGTSVTIQTAVVNFATAATHSIIAAVSDKKHKITTIVFTVAGDTNLTLKTATTALSGAMDFGGTNEPRGMVSNHGAFPLECGTNEAFQITSSGAVQVSGYVLYYTEQ
ncbi:hypothetical protein ES702_06499 [subsurface metagenome]